jgi:hypothetical protein
MTTLDFESGVQSCARACRGSCYRKYLAPIGRPCLNVKVRSGRHDGNTFEPTRGDQYLPKYPLFYCSTSQSERGPSPCIRHSSLESIVMSDTDQIVEDSEAPTSLDLATRVGGSSCLDSRCAAVVKFCDVWVARWGVNSTVV